MEMMYETIYKALVEAGLENMYAPQDYLNFFCLGNREAVDGNDAESLSTPNAPNVIIICSLPFFSFAPTSLTFRLLIH